MSAQMFLAAAAAREVGCAHCAGYRHCQVGPSLSTSRVNRMVADPPEARIVFASSRRDGLPRSEYGIRIWSPSGPDGQTVKEVAVGTLRPLLAPL